MSSQGPEKKKRPRDPDLIGAEAAMRRAALRAKRRAAEVARAAVQTDESGGAGGVGVPRPAVRDPRELTFSQAQGYEELPGTLTLEELPQEARTRIWNCICECIQSYVSYGPDRLLPVVNDYTWHNILWSVHKDHLLRAVDDFPYDGYNFIKAGELRRDLEELPFNKVFDLVQFILRHPKCPSSLITAMKRVFTDSRLAYAIDGGPPPTIVPSVTSEEGTMIVDAMRTLREGGMEGGVSHLQKASARINSGNWAGSIRESIHAVESVARRLDPGASTLSPALKSLEQDHALHPALRGAFDRLYGYTSDEDGIRHALLEDPEADVGMDEAVFMFGACASFASYLWRKHNSGAP